MFDWKCWFENQWVFINIIGASGINIHIYYFDKNNEDKIN